MSTLMSEMTKSTSKDVGKAEIDVGNIEIDIQKTETMSQQRNSTSETLYMCFST